MTQKPHQTRWPLRGPPRLPQGLDASRRSRPARPHCWPRAGADPVGVRIEPARARAGSRSRGPNAPATLPLFDDLPAVASGLEPETGGTFRIFNYPEYNGPDVLKAFGKQYGVKVEVTTFTTMSEAVDKLKLGATDFDVFFPTPDILGKAVAGKLLQP